MLNWNEIHELFEEEMKVFPGTADELFAILVDIEEMADPALFGKSEQVQHNHGQL